MRPDFRGSALLGVALLAIGGQWLIGRHGYRTPDQARADWVWQIFLARSLTIGQDRQGPFLWEYLAMESTPKLSRDELLSGLSQYLPKVIDHLTPDGRLPTENELSGRI